MKTVLILSLILVVGLGCEPRGGGYGYQYLGTVRRVLISYNLSGVYTSTITTSSDIFVVKGKVELRREYCTYVWCNGSVLRLRYRETTVEYPIKEHKNRIQKENDENKEKD